MSALLAPCLALLAILGPSTGQKSVDKWPRPNLGNNADMRGFRPFPDDNPWNTPIDTAPVDPNSANLIASIGLADQLHPDFGADLGGETFGIPYRVVSGRQPKVPMTFEFWDESDPGPYPIPADAPIEGGAASSGDRHILIIDRDNLILYETYSSYPSGLGWACGSGAIHDLKRNYFRPHTWTSADAAGLPIFPGLVRYDEVALRGEIRHALRFTVQTTRKAYVHPARHWASNQLSPNFPPMGMRVRLKSTFNSATYPPQARVVLTALKKYGMIVADNGGDWFLSGAPDARWNDADLETLKTVHGSDFEVVQMGQIYTP